MGNIRIEIQRDMNSNGVWVYASLPSFIGLKEARRFADAFKAAIDVAAGWQYEPVTKIEIKPSTGSGKSKGGKARAESLTPERRSEIARKAAETRWTGEKADAEN